MSDAGLALRTGVLADVAGMLSIKARLRVAPGEAAPAGGFLLGCSAERYAFFVARANVLVLDDRERGGLAGFAVTLPDEILRETDVWARRGEIAWDGADPARFETARVGYFEQLAVLPGCRYRAAAPALALRALGDLLAAGHRHVFATVVRAPFDNLVSRHLLAAVGARRVGAIEERYDGVGPILSDVYHLDHASPDVDDRLARSPLARRLLRYADRIGARSA